MEAATDWHDWHLPYADDTSPLSRRLRLVQQHIGDWLDDRPEPSLQAISVCAGQGHDLIGVLAQRSDAGRVQAQLIEYDARNVAAARNAIAAAGLERITVSHADAGDFAAYQSAVPADLVLLVGVLGNITDRDVQATINAMPRLCAPGATACSVSHALTSTTGYCVVSASSTSSSVWYSPGESAEASRRQPLRDGRRGHTLGHRS